MIRRPIAAILIVALLLSLWPPGSTILSNDVFALSDIEDIVLPMSESESVSEETVTVSQPLGEIQAIDSGSLVEADSSKSNDVLATPTNGSWISPAYNEIILYWGGIAGDTILYEIYRNGELLGNSGTLEFHDRSVPEHSKNIYEIYAVDDNGGRSDPLIIYAGTPRKEEQLLSRNALGIPGNSYVKEYQIAISGNGRVASFISTATNLIEGVGDADRGTLYLRDLVSDTIVAPLAAEGYPSVSDIGNLSINHDGSFIAFTAISPSQERDVYLLDRQSDPNVLLNVTEGDGFSWDVTISSDAERLLFRSFATNLNASGNDMGTRLYLYERNSGEMMHLPVPTNSLYLTEPILSGNGRYVAYSLFPGDGPSERIIRYDLETGELEDAATIELSADQPSMSNDGSRMAYHKDGSIYVWERSTGTAAVVLQSNSSVRYSNPQISGDGNIVLANYRDLIPQIDNSFTTEGLIWADIRSGVTKRLNHPSSYAVGAMDADGSTVVYNGYYTGARVEYGFFRLQALMQCVTTCGTTPPDEQEEPIKSVEWQASDSLRGQVKLGGTITITAKGAAEGTAKATVFYKRYSNDQVTVETAQADVTLTEQAGLGVYTGTFPVDAGIMEVSAITAEITDSEDRAGVKSAALLPVPTTGELEIDLPSISDLPGQWRLLIWSDSLSQGTQAPVDRRTNYKVSLGSASDYTVQLLDENNRLIGESSSIVVDSGRSTQITLPVKERSKITARLKNESDKGIEGVRIIVRNEDNRVVEERLTDSEGFVEFQGTYFVGETVYVSYAQLGYGTSSEDGFQKIVLRPSGTEAAFFMDQSNNPIVTGRVLNERGEAVPNVKILFYQKRMPNVTALSDSKGRYSIRLWSYGYYQVFAQSDSAPYYAGSGQDIILVGFDNDYDVRVNSVSVVKPRLLVKLLDRGLEELPLHDSYFAYTNYDLKVLHHGQPADSTFMDSTYFLQWRGVPVLAGPGETIAVCAGGSTFKFDEKCVDAVIPSEGIVDVTLQFEEQARLTGTIQGGEGTTLNRVYRYEENGEKTYIGDFKTDKDGNYEISLSKSGKYMLSFGQNWEGLQIVTTDIEAQRGRITRVPLQSYGAALELFAGQPNNVFEALTSNFYPGATVTMRGTYQRSAAAGTPALVDGALRIYVPAGAALVRGSVVLDGQSVTPAVINEFSYEVPLGAIHAGQSGTIRYQLRLSEEFAGEAEAGLSIRYRPTAGSLIHEEAIGGVVLSATGIILNAPAYSKKSTIYVSGKAPANHSVSVFVDGKLATAADASPNGFWYAEVELPEQQEASLWRKERSYVLFASVQTDDGAAQSNMQRVEVHESNPELKQFTFYQAGQNPQTYELNGGVLRFPYATKPSQNFFHIRLKFDQPERISNVRVKFGSISGEADYLESTGEYIVALNVRDTYPTGAFSVDYDITPAPLGPRTLPDEQEWTAMKEEMPVAFRNGGYSIVTESEVDADIQHALTPDNDAVYSPYVKLEIGGDVFYGRSYYKVVPPSELPESTYTGVPPYKDYRISTDTIAGTMSAQGIIPVSSLSSLQREELARMGVAVPKGAADHVINGIVFAFPKLDLLGTLNNLKDLVMDGNDFVEFSEKLLDFNKQVYAECHGPTREMFKEAVNDAFDRAKEGLVLKYALTGMGLVTGALTLAVPGAGQLVLGTAMTALGDMIKDDWEESLNRLKKDFEAEQKWRDGMADNGVLPRCDKEEEERELEHEEPRKDESPDIDIVMIYDPSGYVYEGMPSNRLEGVTATVSYKDQDSGIWYNWDADWYRQVNPQRTDQDGRYGWDVPEGLWQVLYEKEGYQSTRSAELQVLPPHFDVNIPMVTYQPPAVTGAHSFRGGEAIHFAFSKPMRVASLTSDAVTLLDANDKQIAGMVEPISVENGIDGEPLAMKFKFIPSVPLEVGQTYRMTISETVISYAKVAMDADDERQIVIESANTPPGEGAEKLEVLPGRGVLELHWQNTNLPEAESLNIYWKEKGAAAFQGPNELSRGVQSHLITNLESDTEYEVRVATVNEAGVESAGLTAAAKTLQVEALIADTTGPNKVTEVNITPGEKDLTLAWQDPSDSDLRHIVVFWRKKDSSDEWSRRYVEKGSKTLMLSELEENTAYTIRLRAEDEHFLGSETIQVEAATQSSQPGDGDPDPGPGPSPGPIPDQPSASVWEVTVGPEARSYSGFDGELELTIPKKAWPAEQTLHMRKLSDYPASGNYMTLMSSVFHWEGENADPQVPIKLGIRYNADKMKGKERKKLGLYQWNAADSVWEYRGGVIQPVKSQLTAAIDSAGTYAVFYYDRSFQDMAGHWAEADVELLAARHVISGVSDKLFLPSRLVSRAEVVKMIMETGAWPNYGKGADDSGESYFSDVASGAWYFSFIEAAAKAGLVKGENGRFRPNDEISREELAVILYRALGSPTLDADKTHALHRFKDSASVSEWAKSAMTWAVQSNLIQGTDGEQLNPDEPATRAETAVILRRLMDMAGLIGE